MEIHRNRPSISTFSFVSWALFVLRAIASVACDGLLSRRAPIALRVVWPRSRRPLRWIIPIRPGGGLIIVSNAARFDEFRWT